MKLYATIENEKGKREGVGGNEYLEIDIRVGNYPLTTLTVRYSEDLEGEGSGWGLYDLNDNLHFWILDEGKRKAQK